MQATVRANRNRMQPDRSMPLKQVRFTLVCLFFLVWVGVIGGRLFWLQIVKHAEFIERAKKQQETDRSVAPRRGSLFDRNGEELAMTVQVDSLYAALGEIADVQGTARQLAEILHTDPEDSQTGEEQIAARLSASHNSMRVVRGISAEASARVMALKIKGLSLQKEFERVYPDNEIAAQVLGFVGLDDTGLGGVEQKFEQQLHGVPGRMNRAMDARRVVVGSSESEPVPGQNLMLTIDKNIQFLSERALDHAMERTHADNGTVVVQDVHSGQILALAIRPTFNPNSFRRATKDLLRNHAVSDAYEPGSTFKLVTYSAALDLHAVNPDDMIDCQSGKITLAGRVIHDDQGEHFGRIPVHAALEHSSDVAAVKLGLKIGPERLYQYVRDFGFGTRTGAEMPGETRGLLRPVNKWGSSSIGSIAMGQEVAVTPLQLVSMVSTLANGGVYLAPHVLMPGQLDQPVSPAAPGAQGARPKPRPFKPGEELPDPLPAGAHRVISTLTAAQMRKMMEGVVLFGTGKAAQLNGYSSGGKTGTAQKIDPVSHTYSKTMHIASFAGFAPVNNPVIAVAVIVDTPRGDYHGASVSAPVFAEVAQQVLEYLGVPHDIDVRVGLKSSKKNVRLSEDDARDPPGDIDALNLAVNELPSDDPLRSAPVQAAMVSPTATGSDQAKSASATAGGQGTPAAPPPVGTEVVISEANRMRVPSFVGLTVRKAIEQAAGAGLEVAITGNGVVREQAPAAGVLVEPGTRIAVRCRR